ncbi:MAG: TetR/AcrR family transcriptional regulator [Clostridia bacterium]|nr:TetR/AcrR family transcriptional regulator [Clostridia bacterium]
MSLFEQQRVHIGKFILDTAVKMFREKGYENTTIDSITKEVGIAKGTFYNFYSSKQQILMKWAKKRFSQLDMSIAFHKDRSMEDNLFALAEFLANAIKDEEKLFSYFIKEVAKDYVYYANSKDFDFIGIFSNVVGSSKDYDEIVKTNVKVKIDVLNSSMFMGIVNWFNSKSHIDGLEGYLKEIIRVCLYGIKNGGV